VSRVDSPRKPRPKPALSEKRQPITGWPVALVKRTEVPLPFKATSFPLDLVDAGQRTPNFPPICRGTIDGVNAFQDQKDAIFNLHDANWGGCQDSRDFSKQLQTRQLDLKLIQAVPGLT
jgi:hypothetical protein